MKKAILSMMALMMAVCAQSQNFDRLPNEKMPPAQAALVKKMPAKASTITPADNQMWWGYYSENDFANVGYGYGQATTIDAFIYIPAGTEMVSTSTTIKAVRAWVHSDIKYATDFKIWISRTVPENIDAVDYVQQVDVSSLSSGVNEIALNTPFMVNGTDLYVGYTATTSGSAYFIAVCENPTPNAFFYRRGNSTKDYSSDGRLALQILIEGGTYPTNIASVADFGQSVVLKGQTVNIPVTITNKGKNNIESISYTIATEGSITTPETTIPISSLCYNGDAKIDVPFTSDDDSRKYEKTFTLTKVNGVPNTYSKNTATGSVITVTASPASLPVVEEFTGTWCGYCPYGMVGMKKAYDKYGDNVALISVHDGDVMAISAYSPVVNKFAEGFPSSRINREGENIYPYYLVDYISNASSRATVGTIELAASWADNQQTSIKFDTKTKFVYNDNSGNYGIAFVLVEDGLKGDGNNWAQRNYLSGGSGDDDMSFWFNSPDPVSGIEYDDVAVAGWDLLDGISGSVNSVIKADEVQEFSYTGNLTQFNNIQDKTKLKAIALLINRANGSIVNAAQVNMAAPTKPLKGDVNEDGKVDVADIATIIDIMAASAREGGTDAE